MTGEIRILQQLEGAAQARGLTVIIDVFRAFSLECYLTEMGAAAIRPVGTIGEAFALRERIPGSVLIGERGGRMCEGFDFGNSPSTVVPERVAGRTVIHTTSAGTQGIVSAAGAEELLTGSLVNARAVAAYIRRRAPGTVSLVCMGAGGRRPSEEDTLCAEYIRSLLTGEALTDLARRVEGLREHGGERFFDPAQQDIFPKEDFRLCTMVDRFPFALRVDRDALGWISVPVTMDEC